MVQLTFRGANLDKKVNYRIISNRTLLQGSQYAPMSDECRPFLKSDVSATFSLNCSN